MEDVQSNLLFEISTLANLYVKTWLRLNGIKDMDVKDIFSMMGLNFGKFGKLELKMIGGYLYCIINEKKIRIILGNCKILKTGQIKSRIILEYENYDMVEYIFVKNSETDKNCLVINDKSVNTVDNDKFYFQERIRSGLTEPFVIRAVGYLENKKNINFNVVIYDYDNSVIFDKRDICVIKKYLKELSNVTSPMEIYNKICELYSIDFGNINGSYEVSLSICNEMYSAYIIEKDGKMSMTIGEQIIEYQRNGNEFVSSAIRARKVLFKNVKFKI